MRSVEFHHGKEGGRSVNYAGMSNFVMTVGTDDLASVFAQGQIGLYHDWCYMFPSYPRSFDLTHVRYASGLQQVPWFKGTTYAKHVRQASSRKGSPSMVLHYKCCTNAAYAPCASAALTAVAMHVPVFQGPRRLAWQLPVATAVGAGQADAPRRLCGGERAWPGRHDHSQCGATAGLARRQRICRAWR